MTSTVRPRTRPAGAHRSHRRLELVCRNHHGLPPGPHPCDGDAAYHAKWLAACTADQAVVRCEECGSVELEVACNVGGVDIATWRRILAMPSPDDGFGDHWSCVMRPGAWEYERGEAYAMRALLKQAGYVEEADFPDRPLGTRWARRGRPAA